jgi:hypothetical protein
MGSGEDAEARVVRMPRSVAEEVAGSVAGRPHDREALVFTAPMGGPLDTYGHLFPSEMEAPADRLEMVRDAAIARRARTERGPTDNDLRGTAGG